jgi:type IV pilus assembly protein PilV
LHFINSKSFSGDSTLTPSKKSKGFSLIEVLIALVILSITLLALAGLMVQTTRNNSFGNNITEASTFAQDAFERLRARPYNSMMGGTDVITGLTNPKSSTGQVYTRTWTIVKNPDSTQAEATITMNWSNPTNHSISFNYNILNLDK